MKSQHAEQQNFITERHRRQPGEDPATWCGERTPTLTCIRLSIEASIDRECLFGMSFKLIRPGVEWRSWRMSVTACMKHTSDNITLVLIQHPK